MPGKKLLSIDNDKLTLEIVQIALEVTAGWRVISAQGGQEGISLALTERPDTILLDLIMPEMNGLQTLRTLKSNPMTKDIPIILFTCRPDIVKDLQEFESNIQGVITKPFEVLTLARTISSLLTW